MKKMNVNKEQISMSELEQVNGGLGFKKSFCFSHWDILVTGTGTWVC